MEGDGRENGGDLGGVKGGGRGVGCGAALAREQSGGFVQKKKKTTLPVSVWCRQRERGEREGEKELHD